MAIDILGSYSILSWIGMSIGDYYCFYSGWIKVNDAYNSVQDLPIQALLRVVEEHGWSSGGWHYLGTRVDIFVWFLFGEGWSEASNLQVDVIQ